MTADDNDLVARIDAALAGITPGEWRTVMHSCGDETSVLAGNIPVATSSSSPSYRNSENDASFIAAAPSLLRAARDEIARLRANK